MALQKGRWPNRKNANLEISTNKFQKELIHFLALSLGFFSIKKEISELIQTKKEKY